MEDIESYKQQLLEAQQLIERNTIEFDEKKSTNTEPIAIIGIGMRFPGNVNNEDDLLNLLINKVDAISDYPISRVGNIDAIVDKNKGKNKIITKRGGFINDIEYFDADFFNISTLEAEKIDPAQRLLLEVTQEAIENAGLTDKDLQGSDSGVFVANWASDYEHRLQNTNEDIDVYATTGSGRYALSGRISYFYNLQGPSMTVDTACSSSVVALNIAAQNLINGDTRMAFVGASNTITDFFITKGYSRSGLLSEYGECRFGDTKSTGYVRSEGAAMIILKKLSDAIKDKNHIHAVILSTATNNDGQANKNFFAPSAITQEVMIRNAIKKSGINPDELIYVEAHGTGTKAGDPTEITSIWKAVSDNRTKENEIYTGSIKTNIGHTEAVAGLAGLLKVVTSLKHKKIFPSLHFEIPNPKIDWNNIGLKISKEIIPWPADKPLIAGINSFGITGTNAHAIIAAAPEAKEKNNTTSLRKDIFVLPLSAKNKQSLSKLVKKYADFITHSDASLEDICAMAALRRNHYAIREVFIEKDKNELLKKMYDFCTQSEIESKKIFDTEDEIKTVFVFPGQGAQFIQMGNSLMKSESVFKTTLEEINAIYKNYVDWDLIDEINKDETTSRLNEIDIIQPALAAIEIALAHLWMSKGILPDIVVGHSMGEIAAAFIAENISLQEAAQIIIVRSKLMKTLSGNGAMGVTDLSIEEANNLLKDYQNKLSVAVINSKNSTVISGEPAALDEVFQLLENQGRFNRKVNVDVASHSPQMDAIKNSLQEALINIKPISSKIIFYSTVYSDTKSGEELNGKYWADNLRNTVQFASAIQNIAKQYNAIYIEMSPHPTLIYSINENTQDTENKSLVVGSFCKEKNEQLEFYTNYTTLFTANAAFNWKTIYPSIGEFVELPTYEWKKEYFWLKNVESKTGLITTNINQRLHSFLNSYIQLSTDLPTYCWQSTISLSDFPYLEHHKVSNQIVFPAAAFLEMTNEATKQLFPNENVVLKNVSIKNALLLDETKNQTIQLTIQQQIGNEYSFHIHSMIENNQQLEHCKGIIQLQNTIPFVKINLSESNLTIDRNAHYKAANAMNLQYGEAFQQIEKIDYSDNIFKAIISLNQTALNEADDYNFHPAALDACIQVFLAFIYTQQDEALFIPASFKEFQFVNALKNVSKIEVIVKIISNDDNQFSGIIQINDEHGNLLALANDVVFERVDKQAETTLDDIYYQSKWNTYELKENEKSTDNILIIHNNANAELLQQHFNNQQIPTHLLDIASFDTADFQQALLSYKEVKSQLFFILDKQYESNSTEEIRGKQQQNILSVINLIQAINNTQFTFSPRLWIVTQQAQFVTQQDKIIAEQHQVAALCRVAWNEHFELKPSTIDITNEQDLKIIPSLLAQHNNENEIAIRNNVAYVARLEKTTIAQEKEKLIPVENKIFKAEMTEVGVVENIRIKEISIPKAGDDEVLIEIKAAGINFMNLMSVLGIYPGKKNGFATLGIECAGVVQKIGKNIEHLSVGDRVMGMAYDTIASHVVVNGNAIRKIPNHLSFTEAATIPVVFLTAYYSLVELSKIKAGEKILIHAATGGVGLAAIQIAKYYGAEIFATAGSDKKRNYLKSLGIQYVYDSRNINFYEEILNDTNKQGVDIVLNSLTGDAMHKSMQLLNSFGRFIEIGKKDIYENSKLGLLVFQNSLSYHMVDLEKMLFEKPEFLGELLQEIITLINEKELTVIEKEVFPLQKIQDAFSYMNTSNHIGKIVVDIEDKEELKIIAPPIQFYNNATYLLTGGYGGLGLTFVEWMFANNAANFILIGRNKPTEIAQNKIDALINQGANIRCLQCNISDKEELSAIINDIDNALPLKGVFHLAGILEDASIQNIKPETYYNVLTPKIAAYNLHALTQHITLDHFVLFSSSTVLFASVGQAAYVASNAYMDALAIQRHQYYLPALSIQWGTVSNVGLAASVENRGDRLKDEGIKPLQPNECTTIFANIFNIDYPVFGAFYFDINKWKHHYSSAKANPYFDKLSINTQPSSQKGVNIFLDDLLKLDNTNNIQFAIEEKIKEAVSQVTKVNVLNIDAEFTFKSLGIDSLMSVQLKNKLETVFVLPLSVTSFWTYPSIQKYAKFLSKKLFQENEIVKDEPEEKSDEIINKENTAQIKNSNDFNIDEISVDDISRLLDEELKNL